MMDGAMAELATHNQLTLVLNGTETDGQNQHALYASVAVSFMSLNGRIVPRMEVLSFRDNLLLSRSAADGERFWNYSLSDKAYTSTDYATASYVGKERDRLFQNMLLRSKSDQTFLAKLLKETFTSSVNSRTSWLPWRPNAAVQVSGTDIFCNSTVPNASQLTYNLQADQGFGFLMLGAQYFEQSTISGRTRTTQWTLSILRDQIPQGTSFVFVPPAGSHAIAVDESRGGL